MSKRGKKSDSDPPSDGSNALEILEEGIEIEHTKAYGVGIDCHSKFIQVSVIVKRNLHTYEYRFEAGTDLPSLAEARDRAVDVITSKSDPPVSVEENSLHYCIESTSSYHLPIIKVWKGTPSVVNPVLAGATKRKTDVLDAKLLAIHDLTGIWKESHIPSSEVQQLRMLMAERVQFHKAAIRISNRINNDLLQLGYTIGREGSVMSCSDVRTILENELSDHPDPDVTYRPVGGIPDSIRGLFQENLDLLDENLRKDQEYKNLVIKQAESIVWETQDGVMSGDEMLDLLQTAPGIGPMTAVIWLSFIITPRRFPNAKALAAYCGLDPSLKISARKVTSTRKRGGNKDLHSALTQAASKLMARHSEPFGQWGYNIYCQTGRWKKGTNAVARRLAVALYYMQMRGEAFSYEKYNLTREPEVVDVPMVQLVQVNPAFKRYVAPLSAINIRTSAEMVHAYYQCQLKNVRGIGKKFFGLVREFISNQKEYKSKLSSLNGGTSNEVDQ